MNHIADKILWDLPLPDRKEISKALEDDAAGYLIQNKTLLVKSLHSLTWYELIELFGHQKLYEILSDELIQNIHPPKKRVWLSNARRLLSKYTLSSSG